MEASSLQPPSEAAATQGQEMLPDAAIGLGLTRAVDASLHFEGNAVLIANQTLHHVSTDIELRNGHLSLI